MVRDLCCYKRHWRSFWKKRCRYGSILLFKCQSASSYSQTKLELRALSAFGRTGILLKIDWKNGCYFGHQKQSIPLVKFNFFFCFSSHLSDLSTFTSIPRNLLALSVSSNPTPVSNPAWDFAASAFLFRGSISQDCDRLGRVRVIRNCLQESWPEEKCALLDFGFLGKVNQ